MCYLKRTTCQWCQTIIREDTCLCIHSRALFICLKKGGRLGFKVVRNDFDGIERLDIRNIIDTYVQYVCCENCRMLYARGNMKCYTV